MKELLLTGVVAKGGAANRQGGLVDAIAGTQGQREAVEQPQRLQVGVGPKEDRPAKAGEQFLDPLGAARELTVGGQGGKKRPVGGADLSQPGAFPVTVTQLPDQQHGEDLGVGKLGLARAAASAGGIGAPEAGVHPVIDDAVDDQKEVLAAESTG